MIYIYSNYNVYLIDVQFFIYIKYTYTLFTISTIYMYTFYLVDPASSHILVSKNKPCMS